MTKELVRFRCGSWLTRTCDLGCSRCKQLEVEAAWLQEELRKVKGN